MAYYNVSSQKIKQQCILAIRYLAIYFGYIHGMRVNSNSANGLTRFSVPLRLKPQNEVINRELVSRPKTKGDPKPMKLISARTAKKAKTDPDKYEKFYL